MLLLNFAHPITQEHIEHIETLTERKVERVIAIAVQFDNEKPFASQVQAMIAKLDLTSDEWQTQLVLVNLPSLNTIAVLVLAELHGRMGYFPPVLRLRPRANTTPTQFEVAEILNLQNMREAARQKRLA